MLAQLCLPKNANVFNLKTASRTLSAICHTTADEVAAKLAGQHRIVSNLDLHESNDKKFELISFQSASGNIFKVDFIK